MYVCMYEELRSLGPAPPLEDLPKITLLEDEQHGNFHLKNLSMHKVTCIHF